METRQSEIDLQCLVDEGGNASLPEIEVTIDPDYKLLTLSREAINTIENFLTLSLHQYQENPEVVIELKAALSEIKSHSIKKFVKGQCG